MVLEMVESVCPDAEQAFPTIIRFDEKADNPETPAEGSYYTNGNAINSGLVSLEGISSSYIY